MATAFLTAAPTIERPTANDVGAMRYLRSFLFQRVFVGVIGVALTVDLIVGDDLLTNGRFTKGSLSAYYYSGMRDVFVGSWCAIGVFLISYKVVERNLDNTLSVLAGIGAVGLALLPTGRPGGSKGEIPLTPIQHALGETTTQFCHFFFTGTLFVSIMVVCFLFGRREGKRPESDGKRSPQFWQWFHWTCAGLILLAGVFSVVMAIGGWWSRSLLLGETVAVLSFSVSWFMKGAELKYLFHMGD